MKYADKLKSPKWQRKRLEIFQRDDFTCVNCGDKESTLHVHHNIYISGKQPWEHPKPSLITLCETCHAIETEFRKTIDAELIRVLAGSGWTTEQVEYLYCAVIVGEIKKPDRKTVVKMKKRVEGEL